ncbi:methylenetetrahydrofolate reductase [NAD(P)H] [Apibacter muscae]|uniref:Methylenetetrahydrofolate reductase n=1 Tax=Apibacter muscae TaxID=2509004 RepID=A0A563DEZ3_9FLAO|nr:methylenetetrahydrofolate reductase [NAD(P)H] [Apibacter muscae]TWP24336.1 methylenetetrahydrofolate reductase [NAD(P)H] [Apibacter muscae]TWP28649.1 methylenetetrahydrofolate reductase [NAD(P)H] [Apibacter muscae]TWP30102.1 methylenetetrahydrofolate reductase [NAD(P)H] [Apibacter muscae]
MKVIEHIEQAQGKTLFSFEILPPKKGDNLQSIFSNIEPLMEFNPPFIDVTYHREEYEYKEFSNGSIQKIVTRKRPGTVGICAAIQHRYGVDAVPHVICGGFDKEETENLLIDLNFLEIDNILVLRGDPIKSEGTYQAHPQGYSYANQLIHQVVDMNNGKYLHDEYANGATNFCIGVAGYPEKHFESPNLDTDFYYLKKKIEAGADYIVTQLFYDNKKYFSFVERCREAGITIPIIPGIKPISIKKHLNILPKIFHIDIPQELVLAIEKCKNNKEANEIGIQWSIQQCKELIEYGVPVLHFYSMGRSNNIQRIAKSIF